MFTGIVTDIGTVQSVTQRQTGIRLRLATTYDLSTVDIGASIAHAGICMTVVEKGEGWYEIEASPETLSVTSMKHWTAGSKVNLERSLKLGDEMGGHMVTGHVDGIATLTSRENDGDMAVLTFRVPPDFARFIAPKGSIALDGTSLTVNRVGDDWFTVQLIPHTLEVTTWGERQAGDEINFEVDLMARYVARLNDSRPT
jgi:riboflavin synthase